MIKSLANNDWQEECVSAYAHDWRAKTWDERFSEDRGFKESSPWIERKESLGAGDDEDITLVMRESLVTEQSYIYREVESYCRGARINDVETGHGKAGQRRAAWLDDTTFGRPNSSERGRVHENRLTATGLFKALKEKVCRTLAAPSRDGSVLTGSLTAVESRQSTRCGSAPNVRTISHKLA